jgi:hypothetical protein
MFEVVYLRSYTPWNRALPEKLMVSELVREVPAF